MRDKSLLLLLLTIIPVTLSGCWDVEEINRKATVSAIFLDTGKWAVSGWALLSRSRAPIHFNSRSSLFMALATFF